MGRVHFICIHVVDKLFRRRDATWSTTDFVDKSILPTPISWTSKYTSSTTHFVDKYTSSTTHFVDSILPTTSLERHYFCRGINFIDSGINFLTNWLKNC